MVTDTSTLYKIAMYIKPITLMEWGFRARTGLRDECRQVILGQNRHSLFINAIRIKAVSVYIVHCVK